MVWATETDKAPTAESMPMRHNGETWAELGPRQSERQIHAPKPSCSDDIAPMLCDLGALGGSVTRMGEAASGKVPG